MPLFRRDKPTKGIASSDLLFSGDEKLGTGRYRLVFQPSALCNIHPLTSSAEGPSLRLEVTIDLQSKQLIVLLDDNPAGSPSKRVYPFDRELYATTLCKLQVVFYNWSVNYVTFGGALPMGTLAWQT